MSGHTPSKFPWRYDTEDDAADIVAADGAMVAGMNMARDKAHANADLIVKAVNSHAANEAKIEALTSALREIVAKFDACTVAEVRNYPLGINKARAALTSAGEK